MRLKIKIIAILGLFLATNIFAGSEDWKGVYSVKLPDGSKTTIIHTPTYVHFTFIHAGKCIHLAKGSNLNGIVFQQDLNLCVSSNIEEFTYEAEKIGTILDKNITIGPTYTY